MDIRYSREIPLQVFLTESDHLIGVGYEALREVNPKLIYCAITGYGQDGPFAMKAGHDINYLFRSGIAWAAGRRESGPSLYNFQIADVAGGSMNAVSAILAAIIYRERTGEGQFIDVSMQDSVIPFNSMDGAAYFAGGPMPARESGLLNERRFPGAQVLCSAVRGNGTFRVERRQNTAYRSGNGQAGFPGGIQDKDTERVG